MKKTATPPARVAKPRGRPRAFDREAALEQAMEVFWTKGYEAASISDLTEAMGVSPPSLYAAFGDKERLFLEAVERYQRTRGESCPYCDEPTARGAIEKLLTYMAEELTTGSHPRGCMMMMAAATSSNASRGLQARLARDRAESHARMRARIERGIAEGDVPPETDAGALADFFAALITGMSMQARDGVSRASLLETVRRAMAIFPEVPRASVRKRRAAIA